jgi:hypothetical protein
MASAASADGEDEELLSSAFGCRVTVVTRTRVQSLWAGYGSIDRLTVDGDAAVPKSVIMKRVSAGRGDGISHQRKVKSYEVERIFYQQFSGRTSDACRVPRLLASSPPTSPNVVLALEDLDASGWAARRYSLGYEDALACVWWLADFHRTFLSAEPFAGLWEQGSYWHLATRPDEHDAMEDRDPLKAHAAAIDGLLRGATHKTLLHGDAKLENFNFSSAGGGGVSAVDFQYTGAGPGVVDLAYLLSGFPAVDRYNENEPRLIDAYFSRLDCGADVESEWRALYPVAIADFQRFLAGWGGGGWRRTGKTGEHCARAVAMCN